ncbi:MAG: putative polymerase subfamily sigma factor [Acidimicrobiales bacterium]|nr:putative polymerase subfamily sigma factor [Acidimicrobiales bacterium]
MLDRLARDEAPIDADAAFDAYFRRAEPLLRRALVAGFGSDLGRDAVAQALEYGWRNWARVSDLEDPTGYLYRVGDRWARRHRRRLSPPRFAAVATDMDPQFEPGLADALARLSRRQRQAVVLVHGFGLSHAETGDLLGVARSSVQNHVERGLAALRASIGDIT